MRAPVQCATGCRVRGQHKPTCDGTCRGCKRSVEQPHWPRTARGAGCDGSCKGCLPRAAVRGVLCNWCAQRLTADVATAPALVRHLRLMAVPTAGVKPPSEDQSYSDPSEGSLLSGAVTAADDLHALLAVLAKHYVDDHPGAVGPDESWARRSQQTLAGNEYGTYVRPTTVAGIRDAVATEALVRWLLPQVEWVTEQEWAGEYRTELGELTANLRARWPIEDTETRPVVGIPCTRCDQLALTYTPPSLYRAPFVVACQNPECGRTFSEDEWNRLVGLTTGHPPTGSGDPRPYVRPARPARGWTPAPSADYRGLFADDAPAAVCPTCHLVHPCDCDEAAVSQ